MNTKLISGRMDEKGLIDGSYGRIWGWKGRVVLTNSRRSLLTFL